MPNKGAYGAEQGIIWCRTRKHTVPNKGAYGVICSLGKIQCRIIEGDIRSSMFPYSYCGTTPILEIISDCFGDIDRVKTQ